MASLGIDGLVSGLDTTSLINSLMTIEQQPQTLLKNKVTTTQSFVSSLQTLNGQVQNLATKATAAAKTTSLNLFTTTSSAPGATATASASATPGSIAFTVGSVASAQVGVTAAMSAWSTDAAPSLTIVSPAGVKTAITAASGSLDDVASAINASAAGVNAVKVAAGTAADGTKQYRLQLTSTTTGAASGFSVHRGAGDDEGTSDVLAESGAAVVRPAGDASVTLYAGTAAEQTITSATNAFTDLLPGVNVSVSATSADPVTVTVGRDTASATNVASSLVSQLNAITSYYSSATAVTSSVDSTTGATTTSSGSLTGDGTSRDAVQRLSTALSTPVNGRSPSSIGISITKDGSFSFDQDVFQAALAADPRGVQTMFAQIAQNVATAASSASDQHTGSITTAITGQQSVVTDLSKQISDWDDRLAVRKASLQAVYTNLETSLSNLKSQSSWITSQLSTLSTSSS